MIQSFELAEHEIFVPNQSYSIVVQGYCVGRAGRLHPQRLNVADKAVLYFEINLTLLSELNPKEKMHQALSKFPSTRRDAAFKVPRSMTFQDIQSVIQENKPDICRHVFPFDVFEDESLGEFRSLGLAFIYQSNQGTLSDDEVNSAHEGLLNVILSQLKIECR